MGPSSARMVSIIAQLRAVGVGHEVDSIYHLDDAALCEHVEVSFRITELSVRIIRFYVRSSVKSRKRRRRLSDILSCPYEPPGCLHEI